MSPVVVSFFTGDGYEAEAQAMVETARAFGLATDVRAVPDLGDWTRNCGLKAAFVRDRLAEYPDRPVVWLDADARVLSRPKFPPCDFAAHWLAGHELISSCLYFGPTDAARAIADDWCAAQARQPDEWDQRTLQAVVERARANVVRLGPAFCWIESGDRDQDISEFYYGRDVRPVIRQTQASRRLAKRAVNPTG